MKKCCDAHDICYDTCRKDKEMCDVDFKRCLYKYCETYEKSTAGSTIIQFSEVFVSLRTKRRNIIKLERLLHKNSNIVFPKSSNKFIKNLTDVEIPDQVMNVLSLGPKFSIQHEKHEIPVLNLIKDVECCIQQRDNANKNALRSITTNILTNHLQNPQTSYSIQEELLIKSFKSAKVFLKQNPNIFVTRSDKGNITVIMYKTDYEQKMIRLVHNEELYKALPSDPTNRFQTKCNQVVNKLYNENLIDQSTYRSLKVYNAQPPRIYGLIKVHKNNQIRPVVPCTQSPSYQLSKFISNILSNIFPLHIYSIKSSIELVDTLKELNLPSNYILISLDVTSLFTNIPKQLIINLITKYWKKICEFTNIPLTTFIEIINVCFDTSYFVFHGIFYQQLDGTAMGNPCSPVLANLVMEELIHTIIQSLDFEVPLIKLYVDDTILAIPADKVEHVLNRFNSYHQKIQFTIEYENSSCSIPFLDICLTRTNEGKVLFSWYEKPISSGRLLNFYSYHPFSQKYSIMCSLKNKIIRLSSPQFVQETISRFKEKLKLNDYPEYFCNLL
ncbi:unnamed protein product [Callosobruchus maculatus]|uniref:Reverse transcriptase domain-containing protein n=1 Tax=Callosobruchus maculatus TaxID=64391 RepID=A0A653CLW7_CALMS|nr:unnamed protein product [Callosobruchus maculatus]